MNFFSVLLALLGVGAMGYFVRRRSAVCGQALVLGAIVGCVVLLGWQIYQSLFQDSPQPPDRYHAVVGYTMGHLVARELAGQRGRVCLIFPSEAASSSAELDTLYATFARVLAPLPSLELKDVSLKASRKQMREGRVPKASFDQAFAAAPKALAYVSFAGVPEDVEKLSLFGEKSVPLFLVYDPAGKTGWAGALKKSLIRKVIVPNPNAEFPKDKPIAGPPEELFRQFFILATPETADRVAAQLGGK